MDRDKAIALAPLLGGEAWHMGGPDWAVHIKRTDGKLVVFADDVVTEYNDHEAFDNGVPNVEISLA